MLSGARDHVKFRHVECGSLLPLSGRKLASGLAGAPASGRAQSGGKPPHSNRLSACGESYASETLTRPWSGAKHLCIFLKANAKILRCA
jgi:hypothetical protein